MEYFKVLFLIYCGVPPLLCHFEISVLLHSHWSIQPEITVRKSPMRFKIDKVLSRAILKLDGWPWKTKGRPFSATWSCVHHFIAICEFKMELQSENAQFGSKLAISGPVWPGNLTNDIDKQQDTLIYTTSIFVHHFISIGEFKLELQSGNSQIGAKFVLTSVTLTFDLWPLPFVCSSLSSVVTTLENFVMIRWGKHCEKGITEGQTDGRTDRSVLYLLGRN